MNNCTLIIDGNWLLMRSLFSKQYDFQPDAAEVLKQYSRDTLIDSMLSAISFTTATFDGIVDNILYVSDGGSWRKFIQPPEFVKEQEYKGTRQRAEDKDWDYIFETHQILQEGLKAAGVTVCHESKIEGDDWAWYWSNKLNRQGTNCIIWTTDNDLKQLIKLDNGNFTAWYNDKNGIFFDQGYNIDDMSDIDYFMTAGKDNYIIESIQAITSNISYINPNRIVMEKIISGDVSDNIRSLMVLHKNGKNYKITEKDASKIVDRYSNVEDFIADKDEVIAQLKGLKKFALAEETPEQMSELFDYNKRLVWLSKTQIPTDLQEKMDELEYKQIDIQIVKNNYKALAPEYMQGDAQQVYETLADEIAEDPWKTLSEEDLPF